MLTNTMTTDTLQTLFLATEDGLWVFNKSAARMHPPSHMLAGLSINCLWTAGDLWLAGTPTGLWRSTDNGQTWQPANSGLTHPHIRTIAAPVGQAERIFVGVEPAAIFISDDGGLSWRECREVSQLRQMYGWYLPYSDNLGCVRSFAFQGERAYAAVEVGGLLRSDDGGQSWQLVGGCDGQPHTDAAPSYPLLHPDVHSVVIDPTTPERVWAATHGGLYHSTDGGETWQRRSKDCYCRALWLDPNNPQHLVFGPATRAEWNGHIEESFDGSASWQAAAHGLTAPWDGAPIEQMVANREGIFALRDDGVLLVRFFDEGEWRPIFPRITGIQAIAVADRPVMAQAKADTASDWQAYHQHQQGRPPRPLLAATLERFAPAPATPRLAVDLGCGDGAETLALLAAGWQVYALDGQATAITALQERVPTEFASQLHTEVADFAAATIPATDLIWASFSLPFCPPAAFPAFWQHIQTALRPDGRFAGHFFGERDSWNDGGELTFHTLAQVQTLLAGWELEHFQEIEEDGAAFCGPKHWHYFEVIARKSTSFS